MWIVFAVLSALFAGLTSILAKCGIRKTDSNVSTAVRTIVVLLFSWLMVFVTGVQSEIGSISPKSWAFLILSGLATGASWLCYFRALQLGDVNKVVPVDKSSAVLTIIFAFVFLHETAGATKLVGTVLIGVGTYLMIQKKQSQKSETEGRGWFVYAALSAVFASLTSILSKLGLSGVDSNLATAIRTVVVLAMAWLVVLVTGRLGEVRHTDRKELLFICLSGLATGASWLCYYRALKDGPAAAVAPIDKMSLLVTVGFSYFAFGEKLSRKAIIGLAALTAGTLMMVF